MKFVWEIFVFKRKGRTWRCKFVWGPEFNP